MWYVLGFGYIVLIVLAFPAFFIEFVITKPLNKYKGYDNTRTSSFEFIGAVLIIPWLYLIAKILVYVTLGLW